ncbi:MAG: sarcosine oxidase subunit delta [Gammaproteobacteria bacterium]|nr:sarcosine oxidase subunit delta [Gammaproteobacteria bacterium]
MIRIDCPFCGLRDHSEFSYGGDASINYPPLDAPAEQWHDAVFLRENIRGRQLETWQHTSGCRMWLNVERDTVSHEIFAVWPAHRGYGRVLHAEKENTE